MKRVAAVLLCVLMACSLAAGKSEALKPVRKITLTDRSVLLAVGADWRLNAEVLPEDATDRGILWACSDEAVAIVSDRGIVTGVSEGRARITAEARDGSGIRAHIDVTVKRYDVVILTPCDLKVDYPTVNMTIEVEDRSAAMEKKVRISGGSVESEEDGWLIPVKTGEAKVSYTTKNFPDLPEKGSYTVYVAQSAIMPGESAFDPDSVEANRGGIRFRDLPWGISYRAALGQGLIDQKKTGTPWFVDNGLRVVVPGLDIAGYTSTAATLYFVYDTDEENRILHSGNYALFCQGEYTIECRNKNEGEKTAAEIRAKLSALYGDPAAEEEKTTVWKDGGVTVTLVYNTDVRIRYTWDEMENRL